jgi:hypothetical protein
MMTLNRFLLVGKDHAPWLVFLAKLEFKWVIRGSLLFSTCINIGHGWQFDVSADEPIYKEMYTDYKAYNFINGFSYSDYPQANQGQSYFIYSIVYFMINFGLFFILNTGLEVKMIRRMQCELKEKRKRIAKMNLVKTVSYSVEKKSQKDLEDMTRQEEDGKKERMVIKMVILNGFFNFILRAPDLLFLMENTNIFHWLLTCFPDFPTSLAYLPPGLLSLLADIGYFTYILTFSSNFLIFYNFNKNFNEAVMFFWSSKP